MLHQQFNFISVICLYTVKRLKRSIWPINGTLTGITTPNKYIWFGLVGLYGISTNVGYLMPNPLYTYTLDIYDLVGLGLMTYQLL